MGRLTSADTLPWLLAALAAVLAIAVVVLLALRSRDRRRRERERQEAREAQHRLAEQVAAIERRLAAPEVANQAGHDGAEPGYVITRLGEHDHPAVADGIDGIDGRTFADILARETVIKTASLVHGVRRALAPETRHRIRFEMGREVKRARKERRAETREALREYRARQRAAAPGPGAGSSAGSGAGPTDGEDAA